MKALLRLACASITVLCLAAPVGPPVVDVDYQRNQKLWRAQRSILMAFDHLDQAQHEAPRGLGDHAEKARQLLVQAAQEIKMASLRK